MNDEERNKIINLCEKYSKLFYSEDQPLSCTSKIKHQIRTTDENPPYTKTYRYPFVHRQEVQKQVDKMLRSKIIRQSNSPWSSPIWIVPKKLF